MKPLIYIAGPDISGLSDPNLLRMAQVADRVLALGAIPFVPYLNHSWHAISMKGTNVWADTNQAILLRSQAVLHVEGESTTADRDVELALANKLPIIGASQNFGLPGAPGEHIGLGALEVFLQEAQSRISKET
jgi:hypothetical protein